MSKLSQANFSIKFQEMLEKYYLQPFDGSYKANLKNGYIERSTHGAQHASRATLWTLIMNKHLQKLAPEYVNSSLEKIAKHIGVNEEELVLLILMTMGCHDAARKGEGLDIWEPESAAIVLNILIELGVEEKHAQLFAAAVRFKDMPDKYHVELKKLGIAEHDYNQFDYIRKLINLGDNLDVMRCATPFRTKSIFDTLGTVEGFDENHHDIIMDLIKKVHLFIYDQHDMIFGCTVTDQANNDVAKLQSNFSKKEKVNYEHAENVLSAIFEDASRHQYFEPFIKNFSGPESKKYEGKAGFDPFLHGTNTSILSILPKSNFQIMSPLEMMDDYQATPMTGELTRGGYNEVGSTQIREGTIGKTSFGIMSAKGNDSYNLEKIIASYTDLGVGTVDDSLLLFEKAAQSGLEQAFSNINLLLIYFTRARQMHEALEDVITNEELKALQDQIEATSQFFYFTQLLGIHIHPDFEAINQSGIENDIANAANMVLTFEKIVANIIKNKINMREIVNNPTEENLKKALLVLQFPEKFTIKLPWAEDKDIKLPVTQFFCLEPNYTEGIPVALDPDNIFSRMSKNSSSGLKINDLLGLYLSKYATSSFFIELGKKAEQHLIGFNDRMRLFEKLVETPQRQFKLTSLQNYFLQTKYPMILVSENENKITLFDFSKDEYRSKSSLKLGVDIKIIATDTHEHRLEIMKYLDLHQINNIQVVLFDDLQKSKKSQEKPSESYHHENGIPTLKWACAKNVSSEQYNFFKSKAANILERRVIHPEIHSRKNISEIESLLEDAQKYQSIDFKK